MSRLIRFIAILIRLICSTHVKKEECILELKDYYNPDAATCGKIAKALTDNIEMLTAVNELNRSVF